MVKAKDVFNAEMMRHVGKVAVQPSDRAVADAKAQRVKAWQEAARRQFPGIPDWEAFERQREWDEDHR